MQEIQYCVGRIQGALSAGRRHAAEKRFFTISGPISGVIILVFCNTKSYDSEFIGDISGVLATVALLVLIGLAVFLFGPNRTIEKTTAIAIEDHQELLREIGLKASSCGTKVYHLDEHGKRIVDLPGLDPMDSSSYG